MSDTPNTLNQIFEFESFVQVLRIGGRLSLAAALGLLVGYERERRHKTAGLRTHMLVCLGSAIVPMALGTTAVDQNASSRVIQGVLQGIGFLGAGTILKLSDKAQVRGLTTAASVWLTAGLGVSAGLGHFWLPILAAVLAWMILVPLGRFERSHINAPVLPRNESQGLPPENGDSGRP